MNQRLDHLEADKTGADDNGGSGAAIHQFFYPVHVGDIAQAEAPRVVNAGQVGLDRRRSLAEHQFVVGFIIDAAGRRFGYGDALASAIYPGDLATRPDIDVELFPERLRCGNQQIASPPKRRRQRRRQ